MEIRKLDHRKIFVSAARKQAPSIDLLESEWLTLQSKRFLSQQITENTRRSLLKVTNIYASSSRDPQLSKSLKIICQKIEKWRIDTGRLRIAIWDKPLDYIHSEKLERAKLLKKIANDETSIDDVIERHFNRAPSQIESIYPLAQFDRLLKGSATISDIIVERIVEDTVLNPEGRLWFLWAATVFAILCKAGVPVKNPKRDELLNGPIEILKKLQMKLPKELQRRQQEKSLRKGAVNAYKMRRGNDIVLMQRLLSRWAKGNFSSDFGSTVHPMTVGIFMGRFDNQMSKATKHKQRKPKRTLAA